MSMISAPDPGLVPPWPLPLESLPAQGAAEQLIILLHGWADEAAHFQPLAQALRGQFPRAAILAPQSPWVAEGARKGWQWYGIADIHDPAAWQQRVDGVLHGLVPWVRAQQQRLQVPAQATALGGFSQGGVLALHAVSAHDGLAGRVLAFAASMVQPSAVPRQTTLHLFHGSADRIFEVQRVRRLLDHLDLQGGDATLDVAEGVGHELHPALIDAAVHRLTHHIPARTWRAALGAQADGAPAGSAASDASGVSDALPPVAGQEPRP